MLVEIKNFEGRYITEHGDVYSKNYKRTGKIKKLKPTVGQKGYCLINFRKNGKSHIKRIHRLVAEAFIPNPDNKPHINHKNGIKTDNRVENLEWVTALENNVHAIKFLGRKSGEKRGKDRKGTRVVQQIKDKIVIAEYYGTHEAERITGIHQQTICKCCNNKPYYKTAGGYQWKYKIEKRKEDGETVAE